MLVYGVTGSGKSTLAERLAQVSGLPYYSVDDHTWNPNWQLKPVEEQRRTITDICAREEWLLDTAYGQWIDIPLARVQLIIALDYPRWISLCRLVRRSVLRALDGKLICNGNRETWRGLFSRNSIVAWHFRSFRSKRARIRGFVEGGYEVIRFTRPSDLDRWLSGA